jgi:hypothetical protein
VICTAFANAQTPSENMFESFLARTLERIIDRTVAEPR